MYACIFLYASILLFCFKMSDQEYQSKTKNTFIGRCWICRESFHQDDECVALSTNRTKLLTLPNDITSADDEVSRKTIK